MDFRGDDPGSVQYGNFINYYQFNSAGDRIKLLPTDIWRKGDTKDVFHVLDIGCNSGDITQLLYNLLSEHTGRPVKVLGIDIDSTLIERAISSNSHQNSVSFKCLDIMDTEHFQTVQQYLSAEGRQRFDAVFCLSITMWIHLNHGDEGLKRFLAITSEIAELLVIEPQPWKCYQTAVKRLRKGKDTFGHFVELKWRSSVETEIETFIASNLRREKIYESQPTKWKRKICIYDHTEIK